MTARQRRIKQFITDFAQDMERASAFDKNQSEEKEQNLIVLEGAKVIHNQFKKKVKT